MKIYSKGGILLTEVNEAPYSGTFMGERFVTCTVKSPEQIQFLPDDYIDYRGERFILDYTPTDKKTASPGRTGDAFQYELKFVSIANIELKRCLFRNTFLNNNNLHPSSPIVDVFANAQLLSNMILASLNETYQGENQWNITILKDVDAKQINVRDISCWDAVALFKSELNLNYIIKGRNITVGTVGKLIDHIFKYGKGKGLTEIVRTAQSSDNLVTKLSAFGGNRNLPKDYSTYTEAPTLMLPDYKSTGKDYIISEEGVKLYGEIPKVFRDEDIYPSVYDVTADDLRAAGIQTTATGRIDEIVYVEPIKSANQASFRVWIKDIGFDINNYFTPATALLSMRDGSLGGYEFEIAKVVKDTSIEGASYKLTLNRNKDDNFTLPDDKTYIKPGDHFVLLEIYMPEVYVRTAEQRLLNRAKEYLAQNDHVKATYSLNLDRVFMANHPSIGDTIYEGDLIRIVDEDLQLDREIIIQNLAIKNSGSVPEYTITLSDDAVATTLGRVQEDIVDIEQNVISNKVDGIKEARRRAIELQLLRSNIFDPDGEIKDTFLQAMMLQVGANSMNYQMGKTTARPHPVNMSYTNTTINLGADDVIHFAFGAGEEKASTWHITTPFAGSGLDEAKTYFVAIKASRDNLNAEWIVDENTYGVESVPGYYVFNFGILSEVTDGDRYFSETRGNIYAYGDELSAGVISSIDRYSWFNLNTGEFQLYNKASGDGLSYKNGRLTLGGNFNPATGEFGSTIQGIENSINQQQENVEKIDKDFTEYKETTNQNLETIHTVTDDLQSQIDGNIMAWDGDYVPTLSNYPASEWETDEEKSRHKGDYFDRTFINNDKKVTERYKFILDNGVYQWLPIADSSSALALQEAREALGLAGSKAKLFYGDTVPTAPYDINDAWVKLNGTILLSNSQRAEGYGQNQTDWKVVNDTQVRLAQMSSDGVISKEEKASLRNEKSQIDKEYQKYVQDAASYGVSITDLQAAYNSLTGFLVNTIKINEDSDFTFSGLEQQNQYNQYFANYYATRTSFANIIANKITETGIGNLQFGGVNLLDGTLGRGILYVTINRPVLYIQGDDYFRNLQQKQYMVSFSARNGGATPLSLHCEFWGSEGGDAIIDSQEWKRYGVISKFKGRGELFFWLLAEEGHIAVKDVKVEDGNKPTSWSPSLADQKSQTEAIAQAKAEVERTKAEAYADGIVTEAEQSAINEAQKRLDALQISGVNLANKTAGKVLFDQDSYFVRAFHLNEKIIAGQEYTVSWEDVEIPENTDGYGVNVYLWSGSWDTDKMDTLLYRFQGGKAYSTIKTKSNLDTTRTYVLAFYRANKPMGSVTNCKLEKGNKPTAWTPSIEDTQNDINYGKLFIRGTGFNNDRERCVILNNNGVNIAGWGRGVNLITINRNTLKVIDNLTYDTCGDTSAAANLINKLNSLPSDVIVVITSYDEASSYWTAKLTDAIRLCGGFGTKPGYRVPYAFVGIPGIGTGNGIEVMTTAEAHAPYAEISTQIISGIPVGVTVGKSAIAFEAQQNANAAIQDAQNAQQKANAAVQDAANAQQKANEAIGKADNATANSTQAVQDAANAQQKANEAIQDAANAQQNANTAIQNAQNAANEAAQAKKEAEEAASDAVKAYNEAKEALTKAQNLDYLNAAFGDISTELPKGVVLSGVIAAKDRNGSVVAGLAGTTPQGQTNYPMIFAGATSASNANNAKVAIYGDGSGWLAGKNIKWDAAGNATFTGTIYANAGEFTGLIRSSRSGNVIEMNPTRQVLSFSTPSQKDAALFYFSDDTTFLQFESLNGAHAILSHAGLSVSYSSGRYAKAHIGWSGMTHNNLPYYRNPGISDEFAYVLVHRRSGMFAITDPMLQ